MTERIIQVLLVEDSPTDARIVRDELSQATSASFVVTQVERLSEALQQLKARPFDLVLLDLGLPDSSGLETFARLQAANAAVPILVLSGLADGAIAFKAVQAGAQDYFVKGQYGERALPRAIRYAIERKRTIEALRLTHEQLRLLLDHSPAVIYAWKLHGEKIIPHLVSENITPFLGFKATEAMGGDWWTGQVHPADRERAEASLGETLAHGKSQTHYRLRHKDGSYHWVDDNRQLVRDSAGHPSEMVGVWTDITERKQAEEALHESQQRLELALKSASLGIWELNLANDTAIHTLRHDQIFGYETPLPEWSGAIFLQHVFPEDRAEAEKSFQRAVATGHFTLQCRIVWPDQSLHWLSAEGRVFYDEKGAPVRMLGINADITERKQAELEVRNQLRELQRWQGVILGREARVLALKAEVNQLLAEQKQPLRYAGPDA